MLAHGISRSGDDAAYEALIRDVLVSLKMHAHVVCVAEHLVADGTRGGHRFLADDTRTWATTSTDTATSTTTS